MVSFVYNTGPRVVVDSNLTIAQGIEKVVNSPNLKHCVFFNDQQLDNSTVIGQIPGIKEDYTLRVICLKDTDFHLPPDTPTRDNIHSAFKRLTDDEKTRFSAFLDTPNFKKELMTKYPALATDSELLSVLSNYALIIEIVKQKDERFLKNHPLFIPAVYGIFEKVFNSDAFSRLFSKQAHPKSNEMFSAANLQQLLGFMPNSAAGPAVRAPTTNQNRITNEMFANAMQALGGGNVPGPSTTSVREAPTQPPEERYRSQIEELVNMGFTDVQANIQALVVTSGNIHAAIEFLSTDAPRQSTTSEDLSQTYATQLEQLREYGFTDVNECLEALVACEGNIEHALELIISNHERVG